MKHFFVLVIILLFLGCESNQRQDLSHFIPNKKIEQEQIKYTKYFSFADDHFPESCDWQKLLRVVDGDTLEIEKKVRVRFIGIDTPEIKDRRKPIQHFGLQASKETKRLLKDSTKVCLISDGEGDGIDHYGRRLAYIFSPKGIDINAHLIKYGFARGYFSFPFSRSEEFRVLHDQAKQEKRGLWKR